MLKCYRKLRFQCNASINSNEVFLDNIVLESCESCVDFVTELNNQDISYSTSAIISIRSNGTVKSPNVVDYHAGDFIQLDEEFEVELGAVFHAFRALCN